MVRSTFHHSSKAPLQLPLKGSAAASAACSHNSVPASKLLASSQNSVSIAFRNCCFATLHKGPPQLRASFKSAGQLPNFCFYGYTAYILKLYVSPSFKRLAADSAGSHNSVPASKLLASSQNSASIISKSCEANFTTLQRPRGSFP